MGRELIGRGVAAGLHEDDVERRANLGTFTQPFEISLQQRVGSKNTGTGRERSRGGLFVTERKTGPVESDEQRLKLRKVQVRILALFRSRKSLDPQTILLLCGRHIALPPVAEEKDIGRLVRPCLFDQA